jgi:3-oxoadipate enol-lactonase
VTEPARARVWEKRIQQIESLGMDSVASASVRRWFTPAFYAAHPDTMEEFRQRLAHIAPQVYVAIARTIQQMDLRASIRSLSCRTLVLCGDQDSNTGPLSAATIVANIQGGELRVFEGVSHFPNLEAPELFNLLLEKWLSASGKAKSPR